MTQDNNPGKEIKETKEDINNDGIVDNVTTTIDRVDVDSDGKVDYIETSVVATDNNDNVIKSSIEIDAQNVDTNASMEIILNSTLNEESLNLLREIEELKLKVSCEKLQHLGSMEDYSELFRKAQQYIEEVGEKNISLVVDTEILDKFAEEAKVYSEMFGEIDLKFRRLSTVDDTEMLKKVRDALYKISLMYENVQKFHATITTTSILQIPDSVKTVTEILQSVTESIDCSIPYIEFFADNTKLLTEEQQRRAELNPADKAAIVAAIRSLDVWLDMISNEANVTMNGNAYIQAFKERIAQFDVYTEKMKSSIALIKNKLADWRNGKF